MFFRKEILTDRISRIWCEGNVNCYLVEGDDRAALIDTGTGYQSLKTFIESVTEKPVFVLLTHGHLDHAGGIGEFCEVYVPAVDADILETALDPQARRNYVSQTVPDAKVEDMITGMPKNGVMLMNDGDEFDVGGEIIRICALPGHTNGSVAMIFVNARMVLLGDALNSLAFMFDSSAENLNRYKASIQEFADKHLDEFDTCLYSHPHNKGGKEIVMQMIDLLEKIVNGTVIPGHSEYLLSKNALIALPVTEDMMPVDGTFANVVLF